MKEIDSCIVPISDFITINESEPITKALNLFKISLHKKGAWLGHRLLIVVNKNGKPIGILTFKNILKAIGIKLLEQDTAYKSEFVSWYYIKNIRNAGIPVREVMRSIELYTIDNHKPNLSAIRYYVSKGVNYIPVINKDTVIGIINIRDLFYTLHEYSSFKPVIHHEGFFSRLLQTIKGFKNRLSPLTQKH